MAEWSTSSDVQKEISLFAISNFLRQKLNKNYFSYFLNLFWYWKIEIKLESKWGQKISKKINFGSKKKEKFDWFKRAKIDFHWWPNFLGWKYNSWSNFRRCSSATEPVIVWCFVTLYHIANCNRLWCSCICTRSFWKKSTLPSCVIVGIPLENGSRKFCISICFFFLITNAIPPIKRLLSIYQITPL